MDVSNQNVLEKAQGAELISTLVELTGLPQDWVQSELSGILDQAGCNPEKLTLEDLRRALLDYLETVQQDLAPIN